MPARAGAVQLSGAARVQRAFHAGRHPGAVRVLLRRLGRADRADGAHHRAAGLAGGAVLETWVVIFISFAYLALLFAVAYYADQRADAGRSVIASPYIYSLSLAVYATAWTY